jgi:DNA-binding transcriptional ArsR family regulator
VATSKKARSKATAKRRREAGSQSVDQRVVKALSHTLRVEILTILNDRMASPNELSKELDEGLSQISYHVKVLKDFDMIELVKTEPRRGAVEHYYRANLRVLIPAWVAKLWPKSAQRSVFGSVLEDIAEDAISSLQAGTFDKRPDYVVGRDPRILDGKRCEDAEDLAAEFFERFEGVSKESKRRIENGEGEKIQVTAALLIFGSAFGKKLRAGRKRGKR